MYKYLFGPVPSRRLGVSLGVDLVKNKRCNFNCVYCECGKTQEFTEEIGSYIEIEELKIELREVLSRLTPDYITFSGSGEPTLNKDIGEIAKWIKDNYKVKIALISNSTLFYKDEVIKSLENIDLVIPTLNSVTDEVFNQINRPSDKNSLSNIKEGLERLSLEYKGEIYLEFFIIEGLNDTKLELEKYIEFLKRIRFTKLQINTLDRKGTESWVKPATEKRLEEILMFFKNTGIDRVEVIKKITDRENKIDVQDKELIKNMFEKREYSEEELNSIYKKH